MMATILLVDDDRMVLEFCDHVLAGLSGFYVLQADSGAEALDTAARHSGTNRFTDCGLFDARRNRWSRAGRTRGG
jgi:CheY-like chemotaxis protein